MTRKEQLQKDMETLSLIMSRCYSDEAYRLYQRQYDELVKELHKEVNSERPATTAPTTAQEE